MSEHVSVSQSWLVRLCDRISLHQVRPRLRSAAGCALSAEELDERLKRDIGYEVSVRPDRRNDHYRRLLSRGYPLG